MDPIKEALEKSRKVPLHELTGRLDPRAEGRSQQVPLEEAPKRDLGGLDRRQVEKMGMRFADRLTAFGGWGSQVERAWRASDYPEMLRIAKLVLPMLEEAKFDASEILDAHMDYLRERGQTQADNRLDENTLSSIEVSMREVQRLLQDLSATPVDDSMFAVMNLSLALQLARAAEKAARRAMFAKDIDRGQKRMKEKAAIALEKAVVVLRGAINSA